MTLIGRTIAGYEIGEILAQGGFARVFVASGPDGASAVLKAGLERGGTSGSTRMVGKRPAMALRLGSVSTDMRTVGSAEVDDTLRVEAELMRADAGRLLPRLIAEEEVEGRPVLLMERFEGAALSGTLGETDPELFLALLDTLATAAGEGRLAYHGDLKPEHVFRAADGGLRLIDPAYRRQVPEFYNATPEYNPLLAAGPMADVIAVAAMLWQRYRGDVPFVDAPPGFALQLQPDPELEKRLRTEYRYRFERLEGLEGVPAGVARFVDTAFDAHLLDPTGGSLATHEAAARLLRECLQAG